MNKKTILSIIIVVFLSGCSIFKESEPKKKIVQEKQEQDYADPYIDTNPIELGMYVNDSGSRTLIKTYNSSFILNQDIVSLEVYYTRENSFYGNQKVLWNKYYQNYEDIDGYKIGYYISFIVGEETLGKTILKPSDGDSIYDYIQVYLYDDINQGEGIYSHITDGEMTDNTILSSIKLTSSTKIDDVVGPIKVMAFSYSDSDFNGDGTYRGQSSYEVIIDRK